MPRSHVTQSRAVPRPATEVWQELRRFGLGWHPWVTHCRSEPGNIRVFAVEGDPATYREQLTFHSDSDMRLAYRHVEGISGVISYFGQVAVSAAPEGCVVTFSAEIVANDRARLDDILAGTAAVFAAGLNALCAPIIAPQVVAGAPQLGLRVARRQGGPLCLFLHGIGGAAWNWDAQLPVAAHHMRAAALDLRGYGQSARGSGQSRLQDHFDDILRVQSAHDARQLVLVGLSFGAWIATGFACAYPDRVAGLLLAGGCTGMSEAPEDVRQAFRDARLAPLDAGVTPADMADQVVGDLVGPKAGPDVLDSLRRSMAAIPPGTYRDAVNCFTAPPGPHDFDALTCPVTLITGSEDKLAPPDEILGVADRIHARMKGDGPVRFETIPDAGHLCNLEAPERFNVLLDRFLTGLDA